VAGYFPGCPRFASVLWTLTWDEKHLQTLADAQLSQLRPTLYRISEFNRPTTHILTFD
jgi:hypothetical protein